MIIVTDTHPLVWFITADLHLSPHARSLYMDPSNLFIIPSIVMLVIKYLFHRKRISISFEEAIDKIETAQNVLIHPLDIPVATFSPVKLEIHDAIIVGTTIYLSKELGQSVSLITKDKTISDSGLVPVIW